MKQNQGYALVQTIIVILFVAVVGYLVVKSVKNDQPGQAIRPTDTTTKSLGTINTATTAPSGTLSQLGQTCQIPTTTGPLTGTPVVYVADTQNNRIQEFDTYGTFITKWGTSGTGNGQFNTPSALTTDSFGNVYVVDELNYRVQKFTSNGTYISKWGNYGTGNGQFDKPKGIAIDSLNNIYVTDSGNGRVEKFTSNGTYISQWGTQGAGNGQFDYPFSIAIDSSNNVYVSDTNNHRVQKFTTSGAYVTQWGTFGSGNGQFDVPSGVLADSSGNVYVGDIGIISHRIEKFTSSGAYISQWGTLGSGNGQFISPVGIADDLLGNIYVADVNNNRIQKFDSSNNYISQWGSLGVGNGQFDHEAGVTVGCSLMPDLIVKSITFNPNTLHQALPPSTPVNFSFIIMNIGQAPANITTSTHFRLYNTSTNQMVADVTPTTAFVLQPNQNYTFSNQNTFTVPNLHANLGPVYLEMRADDINPGVISESNEGNNNLSQTITITP